jgi:putative DNA primase/helicase
VNSDNPFEARIKQRQSGQPPPTRSEQPRADPPPPEQPKKPPKDQWEAQLERAALEHLQGDEPTVSASPIGWESEVKYIPNGDSKTKALHIAYRIMEHHAVLYDKTKQVYGYTGTHWDRVGDEYVGSLALSYDATAMKHSRQQEACAFVRKMVYQHEIKWRNIAQQEVPCLNGVVDVNTCEVRPHRKIDYLETVVPHNYNPVKQPVRWLKCLEEWWGADPNYEAKIDAFQEFFGYCILPSAMYKKMLFLHGPSNSGKSIAPWVLQTLVGKNNTCSLDHEELADPRSRAPIVGKMVNLLTEVSVGAIVKDGPFNAIVSGEPISIDQKFQAKYDYEPFCKHVFCSENLPIVRDEAKGVYNRLLLIKFNRILTVQEQDNTLKTALAKEVEQILAWAVEGAARLIENGGVFTSVAESAAAVEEYRRDMNPVVEFIEEKMDKEEEGETPLEKFREEIAKYYPGRHYSQTVIGRMLKSAGYKIERVWRSEIGRNVRVLKGFRMAGRLL